MTGAASHRRQVQGFVLAAGTAICAIAQLSGAPSSVAAARSAVAVRSTSVHAADQYPLTMTVDQVAPWTPAASKTNQKLSVTLTLTNTSNKPVTHVQVQAGRGTAVETQSSLQSALASHRLPTDLEDIPARPRVKGTITLAAAASKTVVFRTTSTTSTPCDLCLYANAVYPIYLTAVDTRSDAVEGFTRTFVGSVDGTSDVHGNTFTKLGVSWIWPLIDRPHRLTNGYVFTDDDLASSIASGGRLDRALRVVEDVGGSVPITLVIDPELIDELAVMATGHYRYQTANGKTVAGTHGPEAAAWLARLRAVLADPDVSLDFTAYADPDLQSLADNGLDWRAKMPPTMRERVKRALGGLREIPSTLAWPPTKAVSPRVLNRLAARGATDVLLSSAAVTPSTVGNLSATSGRVATRHGDVGVALTSPLLQGQVDDVLAGPSPNLSRLPVLLAELSVRADTQDYERRVAFLAAPRYVDPSPSAAASVIRATTSSAFSAAMSFPAALVAGRTSSASRTRLRRVPASTSSLPTGLITDAQQVSNSLGPLRGLLVGAGATPTAPGLMTQLRRGLQRIESASWSPTSTVGGPDVGSELAQRLTGQVKKLLNGVHIVRPAAGHYSYTLASKSSPLPITVENTLPYRAFVRIDIEPVGGAPGLTTRSLGVRTIAAQSKQTFRVPAQIQRSGRIELVATLKTGRGDYALGPRVRLSVHSTVFGTIGIVITVVGAVVLLLALAWRYLRRLQRLRAKRHRQHTATREGAGVT